MPQEFEFKSDFERLKKFYRGGAKNFRRAEVGMVNNTAFALRDIILAELDRNMTIRSPGFVKGSVRLQKATFRNVTAEVGSIERPRFSGWIEQETGKKDTRTRVQTVAARRSNFKNRVAPRLRLKKGNKRAIRPSDVGLKNDISFPDVPGFLQILDRRREKQPWYLPVGYKRLQRGIYIFLRGKIRRVHNLEPEDTQPERDRWMTRSVARIDQKFLSEQFNETLAFILKRQGIR